MTLKVTATLATKSAVPEDYVVNTFHFDSAVGTELGAIAAASRVEGFYNEDISGGVGRLSTRFSNSIALSGHVIRVYDLAEPKPRIPILEAPMTFSSVGVGGYPSEVALCLSYRAEYASGQPAARRRGRLYIGPFRGDLSEADAASAIRPNAAIINQLRGCGRRLIQKNDDVTWVVYSPTSESSHLVIGGWVDNSWDTQRRRGPGFTVRSLWDGI